MRFKGNWLTRGHEVIVQKLPWRDTYTPTDIPQVRSNCGLLLNREETLSVADLKTPDNNPDAAPTGLGEFQDRTREYLSEKLPNSHSKCPTCLK